MDEKYVDRVGLGLKIAGGLRRALGWARARGYWPPKFRVLKPGDKGDAEAAIEDHQEDQVDRRW